MSYLQHQIERKIELFFKDVRNLKMTNDYKIDQNNYIIPVETKIFLLQVSNLVIYNKG